MKIMLMGLHAARNLDRLRSRLALAADIATFLPGDDRDALARDLAEAEVLVAMHLSADAPPAPRLRLLQLPGAGYDGIDWRAVPDGCAVCNVFEHEIGISEYVLLAMLEWTIRLGRLDARFRAGRWDDSLIAFAPTRGELAGKSVAILGYGHIGREVARRAKAFGMRTIAIPRTERAVDADEMIPVARLDDALARCDFLVIACPITDQTRGLIDRARLRRMKPEAVVINVGRAEVCDEDALYKALSGGAIAGAVLDVWYRYPPPGADSAGFRPAGPPFHELDNVIMTPHVSAWTGAMLDRRWTVIADNIARLAAGRPLLNPVPRPREL